MLVLSRKTGQKIFIGDEITVTVIEMKGNQVRLGIHAPNNMPIYREELHPFTPPATETEK